MTEIPQSPSSVPPPMAPVPQESATVEQQRLREQNQRLLDDLEWAYSELAQTTERIQEESQVAYSQVRDTVSRLERRVAELSTLNEIGRALGTTLRLDQVLDIVARRIRATLPGTLFAVAIAPSVQAALELSTVSGDSGELPEGRVAAWAAAQWIALRGTNLRVEDAAQPLALGIPEELSLVPDCRAWLGVPLLAGDEIVGAVVVAHAEPHAFLPDDERLLASVAIQAAVAVNNARLYEAVIRRTAELAAVLEMSQAISQAGVGTKALLELLVRRARELIDCDSLTVFLFGESREYLSPLVFVGSEGDREAIMRIRVRPGEGLAGLVAQSGRPELVNEAHLDPRSRQVPGTTIIPESIILTPLRSRDLVLGVLMMSREGESRGFLPSDLDFLTVVANHAAIALENARLFESLQGAYTDLKATQNQLVASERLHALGEMASGVAHDFNNVLGAILGRAQLMLMRAEDETVVNGLRVIEQAARDGASTVKRIQDFTRLSAPSEPTVLDVNHVARDAAEFTRPRWQEPRAAGRLEFRLDLHATEAVLANAAELREVVTNLVINAVDATVGAGTITVRTHSTERAVFLEVTDTGTGMSEEVMEKIFHPFFTTKGKKGTGLGLAISQGIVARYQGALTVESALGQGSVFTIRLPAHRLPERATKTVEPAPDRGSNAEVRGTILVVDDDVAVAEVLSESLRMAGHTVHTVHSAREALSLLMRTRVDVMFTDIGMPEMDGWELTAGVQARDPQAVVVVVSGWGGQFSHDTQRARGLFGLLPKPLDIHDAVKIAREAVQERQRRDGRRREDRVET